MNSNQNTKMDIFPQRSFSSLRDYDAAGNLPQFELNPSFLSPSMVQIKALAQIFDFIGLSSLYTPEAMETKRRSVELATMIFKKRLPQHLFNAENLVSFVGFCDAFRKPGFIWQNVLKREAAFIIPNPPLFEIDSEEYMPCFRKLFLNFSRLNCAHPLTLGLFLLFFHRLMLTPHCDEVDWNTIVGSILERTLPCAYNVGG